MITVKVTYTVKDAFAQQNKQNIDKFIKDFKALGDDFRYTVLIQKDRKTFVHLSQYKNEAIQKKLLEVPSFKSFQQYRDESGLESEPRIEVFDLLTASHDVF